MRGACVTALRNPDVPPSNRDWRVHAPPDKQVAVDPISELELLEVGVKTPNGCEAALHVARQWFHQYRADPSGVALSVDISNPVNSVHRTAVLQAVRTHFPERFG